MSARRVALLCFASASALFLLDVGFEIVWAISGHPTPGERGYKYVFAWYSYAPPFLGIAVIFLILCGIVAVIIAFMRSRPRSR